MCPLLIPWLERFDLKNDMNTFTVNTDPDINKRKRMNAVCRALKAFYYFYTAPIIKFFCHSVNAVSYTHLTLPTKRIV